jgi:hypothetical protein
MKSRGSERKGGFGVELENGRLSCLYDDTTCEILFDALALCSALEYGSQRIGRKGKGGVVEMYSY